jgi:hypothetical protein
MAKLGALAEGGALLRRVGGHRKEISFCPACLRVANPAFAGPRVNPRPPCPRVRPRRRALERNARWRAFGCDPAIGELDRMGMALANSTGAARGSSSSAAGPGYVRPTVTLEAGSRSSDFLERTRRAEASKHRSIGAKTNCTDPRVTEVADSPILSRIIRRPYVRTRGRLDSRPTQPRKGRIPPLGADRPPSSSPKSPRVGCGDRACRIPKKWRAVERPSSPRTE